MTSTAKMIVGTLTGIPRCLGLSGAEETELYEVADALQRARNAVLELALSHETFREGQRLVEKYRQTRQEDRL